VLHPPGGLAGGDELALDLGVAAGASALVTMPASTKFYRSIGAPSLLTNRLEVRSGGSLEWLPTETILFGGSSARLATEVHLDSGAVFVGWEALALGRPLSGDHYATGGFEQRLDVYVDGRPVLLDRLAAQAGDVSLAAPWGLNGRLNSATLLAFPADVALLEQVRAAIERCADSRDSGVGRGRDGATIVDGLLVLRLLGDRPSGLREKLEAAWRALAPALLGRAAAPPRIWKT